MKLIAIALVLCVGAWYFLIGGRKIDEGMVRDYYQQEAHAVSARDAERLCGQLSRNVVIESRFTMPGRSKNAIRNRDEACEAQRERFKMFQLAGERLGGMLAVSYDYHLDSIVIAPDGLSATVQGTSELKMGETAIQYSTRFTQRLERDVGQVRMVHAQVSTVLRLGAAAGQNQDSPDNPGDFFRK